MSQEALVQPDRQPPGPGRPAARRRAPRRRGPRARLAGLRAFLRAQPLGAAACALISLFVLAALLAPWIAPYDPLEQHRRDLLQAPSGQFWLGTDDLGRDVLSRTLHGARTSLFIAVATTLASMALGTTIGVVSGYFGRAVDVAVQRVMDAVQAIPGIVLLLFIAVILGPSVRNTIIALTVVITPAFNRIARGETLRVRQEPFIEAARATGAGVTRILTRHVLPNVFAMILTLGSLLFAGVIIAESALSFLGIGAPPPTPSWGVALSEAMRYIERAPWLILVPATMLSLAVFSFNMLGDALRDHFDPRLQHAQPGRAATRWWRRWRPPASLAPSLNRAADRAEAAESAPAAPAGTPTAISTSPDRTPAGTSDGTPR